jgi:hypothetical protein
MSLRGRFRARASAAVRRVNTEIYGDQFAPKVSSGRILSWCGPVWRRTVRREEFWAVSDGNGVLVGNEFPSIRPLRAQIQPVVARTASRASGWLDKFWRSTALTRRPNATPAHHPGAANSATPVVSALSASD